jgi:hypothetical protein
LKGVPVRDLGRLHPGRPQEHLIARDLHHAYGVFLRKGVPVRIDVDQKTVDVRIWAFDPK